jgi:hypothetical protein
MTVGIQKVRVLILNSLYRLAPTPQLFFENLQERRFINREG